MARIKRAVHKKKRKRRLFKAVKGFWGRRKAIYRTAREALMKSMAYSYRDRKAKARDFRKLWIARINAAGREHGMSYSVLMKSMSDCGIRLNRKMVAKLALEDPNGFASLVEEVKKARG